jgi:hypothetical protein
MAFWEFKDYVTDDQRSPLLEWYGRLDGDIQAAFDLLLKALSETEDWDEAKPKRRKYKELTRQHQGLCELFLNVDGRSFRPFGILHRDARIFVVLGGCEKLGQDLTDPEEAFDSALRLMRQYHDGRGATRDYHY